MEKRQIYINPFEDNIVSEPRHIEKSIGGLNDAVLNILVQKFESLLTDQIPRKSRISHAQLIVTPQPGFGKSHMIGRLFDRLNHRAIMIYVKPFEDPGSCWKSILLNMVQELNFPENIHMKYCSETEPSQLEAFAHRVLCNLAADAVEVGSISDKKESTIHNLRTISISDFRKNRRLVKWTHHHMNALLKLFTQQLTRHGIKLFANPISWLSVLFTVAYYPNAFELNIACKDWLEGGSIDEEQAKQIGIKPKDIPHYEMTGSEINQLCKNRIQDFCQLAGFYRPFLFCFDQTENYGKNIALSKAFGAVIQSLRDECVNQMTVVTANQVAWTNSIQPWWEEAFLQRLSEPLELEGLNIHQAKELIQYRFEQWGCDQEIIDQFHKDAWVDEQFKGNPEYGVRLFLQRCSFRYQFVIQHSTETIPLSDYYLKAIENIKANPRRIVFDLNAFTWLVREVAKGLPNISIEPYDSQKGYFVLRWKTKDLDIYFGFESGSHFKRWEAITREAHLHWSANLKSKAVFFRTPDLPMIPRSSWKIAQHIETAKQEYLHILSIDKPDLEKLYAAHDLYIDAGEGNIPYKRPEVIEYVRSSLQPFWEKILQPIQPIGETEKNNDNSIEKQVDPQVIPEELIENIRQIVSTHKLLTVQDCIQKLPCQISEEQFHEARQLIPEIKVHISPGMTVLQWQSTLSR